MQRFALSVAVWLCLLSRAGNSRDSMESKNTLWHVGESNPEAKVELAAYDIANLSCRVRVRCHNVAREINYNLMNSVAASGGVEPPRAEMKVSQK